MTRTLVVVSHTHWDREWYLPFEAFRARLVRMMDALLDLLDSDPEYRHFAVDGQTVPLDDYLEIRPDRRADIERLVRSGRLIIGPNYMLPDEFLIGGEAHIRNLMTGIRSARRYGAVMMVGYAPDAFGHITHLPAILRGFGIDSVLIWRGVGDEATTSEFRWAAPDASEVLAVHFPHGYGLIPALPEDRDTLAAALRDVREKLEPFATTRHILVPNGTDHLPAHAGLSRVIRTANEILEDADVVHGSYPLFVENVRGELGDRLHSLPLLAGEFRSSKRSNVLPGVLSTRIWLKQRYQECEDLLARYAEPLTVWKLAIGNGTSGNESTRGLLRHAWKLLLQNGPHDSVTGCSVDSVYEDVRLRFDRCQQIADSLIYDSLRSIADRAAKPGEQTVVVFNPENGPRTDFCTIRLPIEGDAVPSRLFDADGREAPLQLLERGLHAPLDARERAVFGFMAPEVPPFGYRALSIEYAEITVGARHATTDDGTPASDHAPTTSSATVASSASPSGAPLIENIFFSVSANATDGTLTVEDKITQAVFPGLNRFVDGGERGDEYNYDPPDHDEIISQPSSAPTVSIENGVARDTLELRMTYRLPAAVTPDRIARSDDLADCDITTRVSLYPGVPRIGIETEIDNRAKDHRLRVHFPTAIRTDQVSAEQHFGVVQRPVAVPMDDGTWFETPVGYQPQKTFVDVSDGTRGVMIANRGLPEYEAIEEVDGTVTIALTLLRCVGWLSRSDLYTRKTGHAGPGMETPGAQMPGRWRFHYSIIPHEGARQNAGAEAHNFARPLRAIRVRGGNGTLPLSASLVDIEPPTLALSALKTAEDGDGVVLRVYNIANAPVQGSVRPNFPYQRIERVNLNEEDPSPVDAADGRVELSLRPNEIVTLKFMKS